MFSKTFVIMALSALTLAAPGANWKPAPPCTTTPVKTPTPVHTPPPAKETTTPGNTNNNSGTQCAIGQVVACCDGNPVKGLLDPGSCSSTGLLSLPLLNHCGNNQAACCTPKDGNNSQVGLINLNLDLDVECNLISLL